MLTREQWSDLARFAGKNIRNWEYNGAHFWTYTSGRGDDEIEAWMPHEWWNDFGPLLVKLERWLAHEWELELPIAVHTQINAFYDAEMRGTEQELMQAGCALGATIGATMKPALAADKETP